MLHVSTHHCAQPTNLKTANATPFCIVRSITNVPFNFSIFREGISLPMTSKCWTLNMRGNTVGAGFLFPPTTS
ncbi:hypothetical protein Plhal304r1_c004g0014601 [Plasmopara halstedii]